MKILFVAWENTANVPYTMFRGFNRHTQHHADMVLMRDNYLKYPHTDALLGPDITAQEFADLIMGADIIHLDDMPYLANGVMRYGFFSDGLELNLLDYITENQRVFWHQNGSLYRQNHDLINDMAMKHSINITVSTPDLLQHSYGGYWIPSPLNLDAKKFNHPEPEPETAKLLCSHAPSRRGIKGTDMFLQCVATRKRVSLKLIERVTNEECLMSRLDCPLHFDQYPLGAYGVSSLEGLALGQLVMVGLHNVERYIPGHPFINVKPNQAGILTALDRAIRLFDEPENRHARIRQGRAWLEKYHSDRAVVDVLLNLYEHAMFFNPGGD